jgi:predicted DNA-binding transcriptional regulator YafY
VEKEVIITYKSASTSEITERKISCIMSKISNGKLYISAYCHLRDSIKTFTLSNILEIKVNGSIVDKDLFFLDNIKYKDKFLRELENTYVQKQTEFNSFLDFYERVKSYD